MGVCFVSNAKKTAKPNIIFYLADDQDKYDYGCYGNDFIRTPAVDQLAREGMVFENAFTAQSICAPSRSQLLTGNYPLKNGCFINHFRTKPDIKSVTTYLGDLGYEVILAGKSHVQPASVYDWDIEWPSVKGRGPRKDIPLDSIQAYFKNSEKPFCMFITSYYPHAEYFDVPSKPADSLKFYPFNEHLKMNKATLKRKSGYYRSVEEDNIHLAQVLQYVEEELDDNTLFIYSADHGVSGKFTVYDRGLNVPFVARWPKVIKPGTRSDALIHYTDVVPTFIEMAGGEVVPQVDGKSFLPILKDKSAEIHEYVYGVQTNQGILAASVFPARMIRSKKFKYIRSLNSVEVLDQNFGENAYVNAFLNIGANKHKNIPYEELYDIEKDPFEQNNLAHDVSYNTIKQELATELKEWMKEQGDILTGEPGYMPLIWTPKFPLDKSRRNLSVPDSLENTLKKEDYLILDY
ncbi:sulfatase family protein [Labilibacter marinus]|uniref:sulfatase family protein n=1 Tax=Labilibacter marinus TaxID=1477105 RepID=UPI00082D16FF|nr:sulfatase [Labilibacter marinus]